jgi:hypothetical protein
LSDKIGDTNDKNSSRKETPEVANLKVSEVAEQRDVGRKIARIDPAIAESLNVTSGDALELSSQVHRNLNRLMDAGVDQKTFGRIF